jgi:prefoldin subunit 5
MSWKAKRISLLNKTKKHVKLKSDYAQEVEKCENLTKKLSICHDSISSLRTENDSLISKIKKLNVCNDSISCLRDENARLNSKIEELNACKPSTSTVEHVSICTRCRDVDIDAIDDHLTMIKKQNDHIAQLNAKINEHELENEKFKFARSMLYNGRRPSIKDGIGFQQGSNVKLNARKKLSNFVKGKAPMV